MNPRYTAIFAASLVPVLGIVDYILLRIGGNSATFSAVILRCQTNFAYFALCLAYSFGLFVGHCCFPSPSQKVPGIFELFTRLFLAGGPVLAGISTIASGDGTTPGVDDFNPRWQAIIAGGVLAAVALGMLLGRVLLPQHPLAWEPS